MTVPTHNLYDFVHQATKKRYILLYHYPYGSRDLHDIVSHQFEIGHINGPNGIDKKDRLISQFSTDTKIDLNYIHKIQPMIFCHDQEPLNFDLYLDHADYIKNYQKTWQDKGMIDKKNPYLKNLNLRWAAHTNIQKSWTLLHSELNSCNLVRYEDTGKFAGAYWWSHAIIAQDWYRFAEHDTTLIPLTQPIKLFLTYCRETTGSRQYRQEFLNQLEHRNLLPYCQTQSFDGTAVSGAASAVYNTTDYNSTGISVVLETVFDERIHLTEKILRPIACGHPFMLAAGPGSLQLIRSYGFQTFNDYINESYDNITDHQQRLEAITQEMQRIQKLPDRELQILLEKCRAIAQYNCERFFSREFVNQVISELKTNVDKAWERHQGELDLKLWWNTTQWYKKNNLGHIYGKPYTRKVFLPMYRKHRLSSTNNDPSPTII
jgi:hypothetical protein